MAGIVAKMDGFVTSIAWAPDMGKRAANAFICGCSKGTLRIMTLVSSTNAREEKKINAHTGAVTVVRWNHDGSALVSSGEDGDIKVALHLISPRHPLKFFFRGNSLGWGKVWSRNGNLRSTLASTGSAIYSFVWGPDNDTVLWTGGASLSMKGYAGGGRKALSWKAHDGVVLCCDWNRINDLIVSGGEDCLFKVWDSYGRQLYQSMVNAYVITSVSWCPNG